jgi:spore maturation protein CgeB
MRIVMFYHSLVSDWNHGNAHFLRGVASDLIARGVDVRIYEPANSWSRENLVRDHGSERITDFQRTYPMLLSVQYSGDDLDIDTALDGADLVLVHEWNDHGLVHRIGDHRARTDGYVLLFHDTHHRSVTDPGSMAAYDLRHYDGVLAFGEAVRDIYVRRGWSRRAWTWHEAADTRIFHPAGPSRESENPLPDGRSSEGDLVWIGNWGDDERTEELRTFLLEPARDLKLRAKVYGVRYPQHALDELGRAGIEYGGWLPNYEVPAAFAQYRTTVHIPRRPYATMLRGIPTIRPFEAMACGIPLVSAPWDDAEGLFRPGRDYLVARTGAEMRRHLRAILGDSAMALEFAQSGLETILARHTCAHRVDQLLHIHEQIAGGEATVMLLPTLPDGGVRASQSSTGAE